MVVALLALSSSLLYGVSDFVGGVAARRIPVVLTTTLTYLFAAAVLVVATAV